MQRYLPSLVENARRTVTRGGLSNVLVSRLWPDTYRVIDTYPRRGSTVFIYHDPTGTILVDILGHHPGLPRIEADDWLRANHFTHRHLTRLAGGHDSIHLADYRDPTLHLDPSATDLQQIYFAGETLSVRLGTFQTLRQYVELSYRPADPDTLLIHIREQTLDFTGEILSTTHHDLTFTHSTSTLYGSYSCRFPSLIGWIHHEPSVSLVSR